MAAATRAARLRRALAISSTAVTLVVTAAACGTAAADPLAGDLHAAGHSHGAVAQGPEQDGTEEDAAQEGTEQRDVADEDDGGGDKKDEGGDGDKKDGENKDEDKDGGDKDEDKDGGDNGAPALDIIGTDCEDSDLDRHDGFQKAPRCVETSFGEVTSADKSPSLLITEAPGEVQVDQDFELVVSTRNLKRDRFLGAAVGGYYAEASFLDGDGIQRGHFHTACRFLPDLDEAPDAAPDPAFFLATQDNQGGEGEDKVTVEVPGVEQAGTLQCAVWAGDGSHRVPMMERANQTPAFDIVRITVK